MRRFDLVPLIAVALALVFLVVNVIMQIKLIKIIIEIIIEWWG